MTAGETFPRRNRLLRSSDFKAVFDDSVNSSDRFFTVLARQRSEPNGPSRLGLAISRKCAPRAVDRNRIKRVIRESFRRGHVLRCAADVVVLGRPAARTADNSTLVHSLRRHWTRLQERLCASSPA